MTYIQNSNKTCNKTCSKTCKSKCMHPDAAFPVSGSAALSTDPALKDRDSQAPQLLRGSLGEQGRPGIFRPLAAADRRWAAPILEAEDSLASDGCFGTIFLWGSSYGQTIARLEDRLIAQYKTEDSFFYAYPQGSGPLAPAIQWMKEQAHKLELPFVIQGMTEEQRDRLEAEFPRQFLYEEQPGSADYIYDAARLAGLGGKKLHNKRNHCNRFEQEYPDWRFEPLGQEHIPACLALLNRWNENHEDQEEGMPKAEERAILNALEHYQLLELEGGVLFVQDQLAAFTIGEPVGKQGFDVRFEKADISFHGAYQMINREFARYLLQTHPDLRYLNREEDMGMENLRRAKESYYPDFLLKKYTARWKHD